MNTISQKQKAERFRELHHSGKMMILANIWDPLGAMLMESLEYPAIATASASVAYSNGYNDGENIPFEDVLSLLKKITNSVDLPVTADIESGYADNDAQLQENMTRLIGSGIVGINFEDTNKKTKTLESIESQCNRIKLIRKCADEMGLPLFINARTDVYLRGGTFDELIKRGFAYKEAGADGFFPILLKQEDEIKELITQLKLPINIITFPDIPDLKTLSNLGVARVSLGPSLLKIAIRAMKELAEQLKNHEGLSSITDNEITSDYLKILVNKNY
ncbi:MAG TPA: isocitrate lyase/phosphoenolpyruvate mutase family protein [Chitinophagaceae bacterium]|jgi:2-methylisocitrate lyase-like PEP mutase family enzyme|nr:isocitrate lyase/phosphoenolpyruvate mutase family protein [Chitinophagaceae bacterium]